ncbi:Na+/H+ antiporter subunit A [Streptomyces griseomycini]|uniref:Multicomponent Na+:H+ antiporter subunit A n=1 Tax=Streptomyces griseomycini TaxID=66895 RepID=A0A7W7V911_9ACTN|nr:Na+/H+ antiporter subunit A [Streptomyces griseomycini]MBB4901486.1 multicomponent Na+:H+ antiporter subunit A [Streptomyces griseomycini]GGR25123.1 monovalent cation/H+ antiporter subunit A [Streptomyces griseomycini]
MLFLLAAHAGFALVLPWWQRRLGRAVWLVAALVPLAAVVWAGTRAPRVLDGGEYRESLSWAPSLGLTVELRLDTLALLMLWIVAGVGALVLLYCRYYVEHDAGRLAATLLAFAGAMTGLVLADNLFVLYVFWELTTVASFLLIAERGEAAEQRRAARQALLVTTGGGLVMLLGFIMLGQAAGTYSVAGILAEPPRGTAVSVAVVLVLIGAFAKSAQMPLHGWLPAAMVAPTPVSAYLHAAAMVKAGVYLVARLAPALADVPPWRPLVLVVGLVTLVLAAWRALRATDLKMLLAYGTVSELGMLTALLGAGTRTAALAGTVMLLAHAAFKSALFLSVGILDHTTGTRDIRELSGLGRRMPVLCAVATVAVASMAGLPPLLGYLGKEAAVEAFLHGTELGGHLWLTAALLLGSLLTVAYGARFVQGAFGGPPGDVAARAHRPAPGFVAPVAVLSAATLVLGMWYAGTAALTTPYADAYPPGPHGPYELSLWHGFTAVFGLSMLSILLGVLLHLVRGDRWRLPRLPDVQRAFDRAVAAVDRLAVVLTGHTQVGSLPVYMTVLLTVMVAVPGAALVAAAPSPGSPQWWWSPSEPFLAVVVLTAAAAVVVTRYRLTGVLLSGAVGYGVGVIFLVRGAPDLALTQFLVETMTLVVVVLVLRRMPARFDPGRTLTRTRAVRVVAAGAIGVLVTCLSLVASSARTGPAISAEYVPRTPETGAHNIVNAIIVDFRALDTLGEISVILVAAVGVASLVRVGGPGAVRDTGDRVGRPFPTAHWDEPVETWLPGARERPGGERSVLLEVATRLLFPSILLLSVYLLFSGHYGPGGGFSGGLVAGQAFVLRYLVGGRADLGAAVRVRASVIVGSGLMLATVVGLLPLALGGVPLESTVVTLHPPVLGTLEFATSLFFDIGVYLLVVGVTLRLLSAVGVSLDTPRAETDDDDDDDDADDDRTGEGDGTGNRDRHKEGGRR